MIKKAPGPACREERRGTEERCTVRIETVHTPDFSMDYLRFGSGERTLVILPGLSVQSVMGLGDAIAAAYRPLEEKYTIYVFDRRGDLPSPYTVRDMARDTAAAFRALGLEKVCLFGASQGGMIALVIAAEHPELVEKLVLGSSSAHVREEQYRVIERWIRLAESGDREGLYLAFGAEIYPPRGLPAGAGGPARGGPYRDRRGAGALHHARRGDEGLQRGAGAGKDPLPGAGHRRLRGQRAGRGRDDGDRGKAGRAPGLQAVSVHGLRTRRL